MLWTVILGRVEWKDRAKVSLAEVDSGREERVAVLKSCRAAVMDMDVYVEAGGKGREVMVENAIEVLNTG